MTNQIGVEGDTRVPAGPSEVRAESLRQDIGILTQDDMALMLGINVRRLAEWRMDGVGPDYVKLGRSVFYRRVDVLDWIEANVVVTKNRAVP